MVPRTHLMFSHTHKGQHYNMELLSKFLTPGDTSPRLIDYELLTDENGRRTVGFGWFAGGKYGRLLYRTTTLIPTRFFSCWSIGVAVRLGTRASRDRCRVSILGTRCAD